MSELFMLSNTEQERFLTLKDEDDIEIITQLLNTGEPLLKAIKTIELVSLENKKTAKIRPLEDFPNFFTGMLLANEVAKNIVEPLLLNCGQWIEMTYESTSFYYFNVTAKLDVVDLDKSDLWVVDGITIGVNKFAFKAFDNTEYPIFKFAHNVQHSAIVTKQFVDFIENKNLSGLNFIAL